MNSKGKGKGRRNFKKSFTMGFKDPREEGYCHLTESKAVVNRYQVSRELDAILADESLRLLTYLDEDRVSELVELPDREDLDDSMVSGKSLSLSLRT